MVASACRPRARGICSLLVAAVLLSYGSVVAQAGNSADTAPTKSITFDTIKFDMKKGDPFERKMLTADINKLTGKPVRISGYILPSFQASGIKQFVLVRDNMECCFGPGAALFDCILVEMTAGKTTDYTVKPVTVEGTFTIKEFKGLDGKHLAIYHLDGKDVK